MRRVHRARRRHLRLAARERPARRDVLTGADVAREETVPRGNTRHPIAKSRLPTVGSMAEKKKLVVVGAGMVAQRLVEALEARGRDRDLGHRRVRRGVAPAVRPRRADVVLQRPRPRRPAARRPRPVAAPGHPAAPPRAGHGHRPRGHAPSRPRAARSTTTRSCWPPARTPRCRPSRAPTCPDRSSTARSTTSPSCAPGWRSAAGDSAERSAEPSSVVACSGWRRPVP